MPSVAPPLLIECDRLGRLVWMNERARALLGCADGLLETVCRAARQNSAPTLRFTRLLEWGDTVWIGAELSTQVSAGGTEQAASLLRVQSGFLRQYLRLHQVERELSARTRRLRRRAGEPSALSLLERERQRLGRELHTGVGQLLAAIRLQLEIIAAQYKQAPPPVQEALGRISNLAADALEQIRSVSRRLYAPGWQTLGLEEALRSLWELSGIPQHFDAALQMDPLPEEPPLDTKIVIYRGMQEALSNLTRYSRATRVLARLRVSAERLILTVEDNGVGFDVGRLFSGPGDVSAGIGLRSIREQAEAIDGTLFIRSGPNGTTLEISAPLTQTPRDGDTAGQER